ncbi:MAG: hypothetical protein ACO1SX_15690 [Actinomycetota bacterium]
MPEPVPSTCKVKDLGVTLLGTRKGLSGRDLRTPAVGRERRWARLDLRLTQNDAPSRLWLPQGVQIIGGAGERYAPAETVTYFDRDGEGCIAFPEPRLKQAAAWKVRLEVARSPRYLPYEFWSVFRPEELWTVPLLPVPPARGVRKASPHASVVLREGVRLRLVQMAGAKAPAPRNMPKKPGAAAIQVRYSPALTGVNVMLVRATDFKGRMLTPPATSLSGPVQGASRERLVSFPVKPQPDSRLVSATFAVHHSRFMEFTARPEPAVAASPALTRR